MPNNSFCVGLTRAQTKKFYSSMWVCRRTIGKTWGINPKIALWMYKVVQIRPGLIFF